MVPVQTSIVIDLPVGSPSSKGRDGLVRTAIHNGGEMHAMPMYGGSIGKLVVDVDVHYLIFVPYHGRAPEVAIYTASNGLIARCYLSECVSDNEVKSRAR